MSSMIELVKNVLQASENQGIKEPELVMTRDEYNELVKEIYASDVWLSNKYPHPACVPTIFTFLGVKIKTGLV